MTMDGRFFDMIRAIIVIVITAIVFIGFIIDLAKNKQSNSSGSLMGMAAVVATIGGLLLYGFPFSKIFANPLMAVIRTLLATLGMFLGKNEYSAINAGEGLEFVSATWFTVIFWIIHLLAMFATANAFFVTIGAKALKRLRMLAKRGKNHIILIFGVDKYSLSLGSELSADKDALVIFIDKSIDANIKTTLDESGYIYFVTNDAVDATSQFLKNIHADENKKITVYAINHNEILNFDYAVKLKNALKEFGIAPEKTSITLLANMEMRYGEVLQGDDGSYGFGSVMVLDRAYLVAHTLCKKYPPCDYVEFDTEKAKAVDGEVFNTVIIGFGKMGQAVLKNLVINGQFEGCDFKATVFDPKHSDVSGYLYKNSRFMMEKYDISLLTESAQ